MFRADEPAHELLGSFNDGCEGLAEINGILALKNSVRARSAGGLGVTTTAASIGSARADSPGGISPKLE